MANLRKFIMNIKLANKNSELIESLNWYIMCRAERERERKFLVVCLLCLRFCILEQYRCGTLDVKAHENQAIRLNIQIAIKRIKKSAWTLSWNVRYVVIVCIVLYSIFIMIRWLKKAIHIKNVNSDFCRDKYSQNYAGQNATNEFKWHLKRHYVNGLVNSLFSLCCLL